MQETLQFFEDLTKEVLDDLKKVFAERQLYVLFEPQLGCEAQTDHVFAKDVFPLFSAQICRLLDAFLAKSRAKITQVFNNELETYNKLISANNNQLAEAMQEMQSREYMLTSMQELEPQFKERIEKEFRAMKREVQRLMGLLGQKAELSEMELLLSGSEQSGGSGGGKTVRDLRSRLQTMMDQNQQLKSTLDQQIRQVNVLNASISDLNADREKFLTQIAQLTEQIKELQPETQETAMNTELDATAMAGLADLFHTAPKQIEDLKQRNTALESVTDELRQENDKLTDENEEFQRQVSQLKQKLADLDKNSSEASRDLRVTNQELQTKILTMQDEIQRQTKSLTEENQSLKQQIDDLQKQLSSITKKLFEQQKRADDFLAEKNKLTQQLISGGPKGRNIQQKGSSSNLIGSSTAQTEINQKVEEIKQEFEQQLQEALEKQKAELQLQYKTEAKLMSHEQEYEQQIQKLDIKEVGIQVSGDPKTDQCNIVDYSVLAKAVKMGINLDELDDENEAQSDGDNDEVHNSSKKSSVKQKQRGTSGVRASSQGNSKLNQSLQSEVNAQQSNGVEITTERPKSKAKTSVSNSLTNVSEHNYHKNSTEDLQNLDFKKEAERLTNENHLLKAQITELQRLLSASKQRQPSQRDERNNNTGEHDLEQTDLDNQKTEKQNLTQAQLQMLYHPPPRRLSEQEQIEERNRQKQAIQDKIKLHQQQQSIEQQMLKYGKIFDEHGNSMLEKPNFLQNSETEAIVVQNSFTVRNVQTKEVKQETQQECDQQDTQVIEKKSVKMIILANKEEVEESTFFISLDGKRIIDQFGNELGHDGYMRNKSNNIITNYKEKLLQQRKALLAKLNRSSTTKNVLKGQKLDHYNRKMKQIRERLLEEYNEKQKEIQKRYENHHYKRESIYNKIPTIASIGFDIQNDENTQAISNSHTPEQQYLQEKHKRPRIPTPYIQLQQQQLQQLLFGVGDAQNRIQAFVQSLQNSGAMPQYNILSSVSPQSQHVFTQQQDLPRLQSVQFNISHQTIGQQPRESQNIQQNQQTIITTQSLYPQQTIQLQQLTKQNQQQQLLMFRRQQKQFESSYEKLPIQNQQMQSSYSQQINFGTQTQRSASASLGASQLIVSHFQQEVDLSNSQESVQNMHLTFSPETQKRLRQLMESRQNNIYKKKQMPRPSIINNYSIMSQQQKERLINERMTQQETYDKMVKINRPE